MENLMDIKSLLDEKVKSSLDYAKTQKQESLDRTKAEAQSVSEVYNAVRQLSGQVAKHNIGISLKIKDDKIILKYKYGNKLIYNLGNAPQGCIDIRRSVPGGRGLFWYRIGSESDMNYLDDAKETIDMITGWCAFCITDSMSARGKAAKRRVHFRQTITFIILGLFVLLFVRACL
jgi:hypothetical protein